MLDTIANFDIVLFAILLLEGGAVLWLLPLGASPEGVQKQRIGRFLLPLLALAIPFMLFLPPKYQPCHD